MFNLCIFEYVYFVCLDLVIDGVLVYVLCVYMGEMLGEKIKCEWGRIVDEIDVVIFVFEILNDIVVCIVNVFYKLYC